ncbi:MAG: GTPase HflX, partial [Gammaproteobacteria bacterium]|nr:GTPase HflX [Gammaproteobacteria bacterium]
LHVVDAANESHGQLIREVENVLEDIGAGETPILQVFNKIDLMDERIPSIDRDDQGRPWRVWVSAQTGQGIELLLNAVGELLAGELVQQDLVLRPAHARLRSRLYARGAVEHEAVDEQGLYHLKIKLARNNLLRILDEEGLKPDADYHLGKPVSTVDQAIGLS